MGGHWSWYNGEIHGCTDTGGGGDNGEINVCADTGVGDNGEINGWADTGLGDNGEIHGCADIGGGDHGEINGCTDTRVGNNVDIAGGKSFLFRRRISFSFFSSINSFLETRMKNKKISQYTSLSSLQSDPDYRRVPVAQSVATKAVNRRVVSSNPSLSNCLYDV